MANRRKRFKKLYPKRLKNAVWNIQSIGKLSARTNYIYENNEVDEILLTLIFEIKGVMAKFGLGSTDMSSVFTTETEKKGPVLKEETDELIKKLDETSQLVKKCDIILIEVVVRNIAAGSLAKGLGLKEGEKLPFTIVEFYYKKDELNELIISAFTSSIERFSAF